MIKCRCFVVLIIYEIKPPYGFNHLSNNMLRVQSALLNFWIKQEQCTITHDRNSHIEKHNCWTFRFILTQHKMSVKYIYFLTITSWNFWSAELLVIYMSSFRCQLFFCAVAALQHQERRLLQKQGPSSVPIEIIVIVSCWSSVTMKKATMHCNTIEHQHLFAIPEC